MIKAKAILILTIVTLGLMLWQARIPLWNQHLQVDIWVWWQRIEYWFEGRTFSGLTGNEILPLTLLYIFVPVFFIPWGWLSYANYLPAALLVNLAVIGAHVYLVKTNAPKNLPWFLLGLIALGPILLFRFDALVTLTVLLSLLAFAKEKFARAGFWLGLATGLKVFPIIILPYLALALWRKRQWKQILTLGIYFLEALILPVLVFFILGGNLEQIGGALGFHSLKLISIESLPGSLITGWSLLTKGVPPALLAGYGIWAVPGPAALFNRLWLVPLGLVYYLIYQRGVKAFGWNVPLALILTFLVFSKNLNPQYLWWFMALLPFARAGRLVWTLTLAVAFLNQLVYPLFYTTLIENFYQKNQSYWIYYLLLLRNLGIVYLTWKILYPLASKIKGKLASK